MNGILHEMIPKETKVRDLSAILHLRSPRGAYVRLSMTALMISHYDRLANLNTRSVLDPLAVRWLVCVVCRVSERLGLS